MEITIYKDCHPSLREGSREQYSAIREGIIRYAQDDSVLEEILRAAMDDSPLWRLFD